MQKLFKIVLVLFITLGVTACSSEEDAPENVVQDGDTVNIDFVGTYDGEQFTGGSADDYDLRIGSGRFVGNFEQQLIGMEIGETKTITVTFPGLYTALPKLAGEDVQFEVTINSIDR